MNALADLLEFTATRVGDLVRETREDLEDHGDDAGVAPSGSGEDLLAIVAEVPVREQQPVTLQVAVELAGQSLLSGALSGGPGGP